MRRLVVNRSQRKDLPALFVSQLVSVRIQAFYIKILVRGNGKYFFGFEVVFINIYIVIIAVAQKINKAGIGPNRA